MYLSSCISISPATHKQTLTLNVTTKIENADYSRKKQKAALAGSSVKVAARDVVATYKVMVFMVFAPCSHLVYTGLCWMIWGVPRAVLFFFFAPVVVFLGIKGTENLFRLVKSIRPLLLQLTNPKHGAKLVGMRNALKESVRKTVEVGV